MRTEDPPARGPLRVALVSTAAVDVPGSMRAYAHLLRDALASGAPDIDARLVELDPVPARGALASKLATLALPWRGRRQRGLAPDVWHVLDGSRAYVAAALHGMPVVMTAHDIIPVLQQRGSFPGAPVPGLAARWLWRRNLAALRASRRVICVSESTRRDLSEEGVRRDNMSVVPLPIRPSLLDEAARGEGMREPGMVLHVGNNAFYKGREQVLRVFAQLDPVLARRLVMIGPAPPPAMRALAAGLGIEGRVEWIEDAADGVLAGHYLRASLMLFPSLYEGFGWPVLEAMAFGVPVVASDAGSLPEVVGGAAPCLAPDDVAGFVREAEAILRDGGIAALRSCAGRERAKSFSLETLARGTATAYRAAMGSQIGHHQLVSA